MPKKFLISVLVILLLSSGAFAGIGQVQGFSIGAVNMVKRVGGPGSAERLNIAIVGHKQKAGSFCCGSVAMQKEVGILGQYASVDGRGGKSFVLQGATVQGLQGQLVVGRGPKAQGQSLNMSLGQLTVKNGGVGGAIGVQGFVGYQTQRIDTPRTKSTQSQFVGAVQYSNISGSPSSNIVVGSILDINMGQGQIVR